MLYLSLLTLPRTASRWRFLQPYQLHQVLWKGFSDISGKIPDNRFLYRHDEREQEHSVLVQSAVAPDWSFLESETDGTCTQVKKFDLGAFSEGTRFRFLLRANPVVLRRGYPGEGRRGEEKRRLIPVGSDRQRMAKRLGLSIDRFPSREEQLLDWLQKKGKGGGFELMDCVPGPNHDYVVRRVRKEPPLTLTGVEFEGILRITDSNSFATTLQQGIGRGKGFGFGLLSMMRT